MHGAGTGTRRAVVVTLVTGMAGCFGGENPNGSGENPVLAPASDSETLTLSSPAFDEGQRIPARFGRPGDNRNPPLSVEGVPADAGSLALIVDDPDAVDVGGEIWVHWLVWNIPVDRRTIPAGWNADSAIQGENDFGNIQYDGPDPPDEPHRYRFKIFAVDGQLELDAGADATGLGKAVTGRIVDRAQLVGTYPPGGG